MTSKEKIYMDYAAGAPVKPAVLLAMSEAAQIFANPSSYSSLGTEAREEINKARATVADFLGCIKEEVVFTSSGSESNSLALQGLGLEKGDIVLTTPIEHKSVVSNLKKLAERGVRIEYIKINEQGLIDLNDFRNKLELNPRLVTIIYANNEIGSIQPLVEIGKLISAREDKLIFHVDACQAAGYLPMNVRRINADLLTFNGSKIGGPRGSGVLFVKKGIKLSPQIVGGDQEFGLRAGTENLHAIVGLAEAVRGIKKEDRERVNAIRELGLDLIKERIPEAIINGPLGDDRLANNINVSLPDVESDIILAEMDKRGVIVGSGSACTSHSVDPSHVLQAIGVPEKYIKGAIRISFGPETSEGDMDYTISILRDSFNEVRERYNKG